MSQEVRPAISTIRERDVVESGMIGYVSYICYQLKKTFSLEIIIPDDVPYSQLTLKHDCRCGCVIELNSNTNNHHHFYQSLP